MTKIKITQVKSGIDRPERQKLTLRALGLNKMNASREVEATAQILGMVRKVNHLITIEQVEESASISNGVQTSGAEEITSEAPGHAALPIGIPDPEATTVLQTEETLAQPQEYPIKISGTEE